MPCHACPDHQACLLWEKGGCFLTKVEDHPPLMFTCITSSSTFRNIPSTRDRQPVSHIYTYINMHTPAFVCAALLGLAQHVVSHPTVKQRAPKGPKIGGANFPGMRWEHVVTAWTNTNVQIQILLSLEPTTAGMPLQHEQWVATSTSRSQNPPISRTGVLSQTQTALKRMHYPLYQAGSTVATQTP
jgi:hypothetical protein